MNWYVQYTASCAERQVEQALNTDGIETFLPLYLSPRKWFDRMKMVELALFSSFLFVNTADKVLRILWYVTAVARIVYCNETSAIIKQKEIDFIDYLLIMPKVRNVFSDSRMRCF
jgi:hypothetical protein